MWSLLLGAVIGLGCVLQMSSAQRVEKTVDLSECGIRKSCYRDPVDCTDCDYVVTWKLNGQDKVDFEIQGSTTGNKEYIALGLSRDQMMSSSSVTDCLNLGTDPKPVDVQMSYNVDGREDNEPLTDRYLGLVDGSSAGYFGDGRITCRFTRYITPPAPSRNKRQADAAKVFNLDESFYLLLAKGGLSSGSKQYHGATRIISPSQVDLTSTDFISLGGSVVLSSNPQKLIKTHGILMILAWMISASIAVLMPRYYKTAWPGKEWCGKAIWFQIHMPLMTVNLLLTVIAFIIIFSSVEGYADSDDYPDKVHPPLGIITTALVIINPIMAAFRPHPGTPKRPIFNVFHFIVGLAAHICAIASIFCAMYMEKAGAPEFGVWVMVAYILWHALIEISLAIHMHITSKTTINKRDKYEMNQMGAPQQQPDTEKSDAYKASVVKTVLVGLHVGGVVALGLALIVPIALG